MIDYSEIKRLSLLSGLKVQTKENFYQVNQTYPIKLSEHIKNTILESKSHAIATQFLPQVEEVESEIGIGAFFPEEKHKTERLVQKYPNRCMIYTTGNCFANCRHCSRKEKWKENNAFSINLFDESYLEILRTDYYEEVLLTGGDALTNNNNQIAYMLEKLSSIKHIKTIRLATRAFTSNPKRITSELCAVLEKYNKTIIVTQFNSKDEFTKDTVNAIRQIQHTGIPILNQSVLLKGVNDEYILLKELLSTCAEYRVIPYYLFHCFNVRGVQHLRTTIEKGIELTNKLVGNVGGWWIPRYILIPDSTGIKVPMCPNGFVDKSDGFLIKDFRGETHKYI